MGGNDSRRARWSIRQFIWSHFVMLAIAITVGPVEPGCISHAEAASSSSRVAFNSKLETVLGSMVFVEYTFVFNPFRR
jgi:hypothetical protein